MAPSLQTFITALFLFFTLHQGGLQANPECNTGFESSGCPYMAEGEFSNEENPCYSPEWQYCYNITHNSATFEWEEVWGASYYTIQWRYPNGTWYNVPGYCYQNWITVGNFNACTSYEWRVRSHCGSGYYSNWCYPNYFTTHCYSCHPPEWLQCYDITDHSATWKWASVYGADYYMIQWRNPGGYWNDLYGGPFYGTWVNVDHLNPCTTYEWRVKSYCYYGGWSSWC